MTVKIEIQVFPKPQFGAVKNNFGDNFEEDLEVGASFVPKVFLFKNRLFKVRSLSENNKMV